MSFVGSLLIKTEPRLISINLSSFDLFFIAHVSEFPDDRSRRELFWYILDGLVKIQYGKKLIASGMFVTNLSADKNLRQHEFDIPSNEYIKEFQNQSK